MTFVAHGLTVTAATAEGHVWFQLNCYHCSMECNYAFGSTELLRARHLEMQENIREAVLDVA